MNLNHPIRSALFASAAAGAVMTGPLAPAAQAQALQPAVDVCTGISLPRSAVTDVVEAVNQPIVDQIETTVNGLTTVTLVLNPLADIPDLDIDLTSILAGAAAGDPITLQVVDTDGNILTPSDSCNVTADGYALNTEGGIAIGGNQITGLGADGAPASAGALDSIAVGNNAATAPGATGAIALGADAAATAPNGVALGAGSLADRGPLTGYAAPGIGAPVSSAGAVSIGAPGAERQLTNVAPASAVTDATTLGQVQGLIAEAATPLAVQYDDADLGAVTLGGADGTLVTNLAPGTLGAGSTDAVNGSQLFATNEAVAANSADIAALDTSSVQYDDAGQGAVTLGGAGGTVVTNLAAGALTPGSTDAVNGAQLADTNLQLAETRAALAAIDPAAGNAVSYDDDTLASVTLGGAAGTTIGNLADGALAQDSAEAVNGSQLFATNALVAANGDDIAELDGRVTVLDTTVEGNVTQIAALDARLDNVPVGYVADADPTVASDVPTDTAAFSGASGAAVRVTNVAAGNVAAGSTDAVNGGQLAATNAEVAANRTDIDANTADISTINANLAGSTVVAVQYSDPSAPAQSNGGTITNDATLVGANPAAPVGLHNVANATLANDAVNLGQLQGGMASVLADANGYTDMRFDTLSTGLAQVNFDLSELREDAFAGTAGAMALAAVPQTMYPDRPMIGGGIGHYRGETAFAIGASAGFNDGRGVLKAGGTLDTNGHGGFSAGAGFSF